MARDSFEKGVAAYPMLSKLHAVHEIGHMMQHQAALSNYVLNPAVHACSVDEDMVGSTADDKRFPGGAAGRAHHLWQAPQALRK